jgi:hypothetical protein
MSITITDQALLAQLRRAADVVELKDPDGNVVGRFAAAYRPGDPIIPWEPGVTREELDRRDAQPGYTFDEVKKRLGWE